ncbi:thioredoxin-like protein [Ochromonadaceae sp. CCMP2298]|nr:thioredoxin-like protein [Ochromonadaceae sp. CCMP2298]|mmetsp:Transcript_19461/g.43367  ORF Transcript_19461/g.43367 Transcript_19461/m.43367 type:complete len:448 (+) Transcript_19461:83-1426(+)
MSELSDSQRATLQTFQEIASINDEYLCIQILQQHNWDLDLALNTFVASQSEDTSLASRSEASRPEGNAVRRTNRSTDSSSTSRASSRQSASTAVAPQQEGQQQAPGGLFGLVLVPLRWLFQARPTSLNPEQDTVKFVDEYNLKVSPTHPSFHLGSYQSAVARAFQQSKFLLVYLHSPLHGDSTRFCRGVLGSPAVVAFVNQNAVMWAGRVWDPEAYGLSTQLRASAFPFLALLVCQSNRTVQIADRIQGYVEEPALLDWMRNSVGVFTGVISRNQAEAQRRDEAANLRAQQDQEYLDSAEADRIARERLGVEQREQAAAAEERRVQEEMEQSLERSRLEAKQDKLSQLRESFEAHPEPEADASVSTVRFQLPTGKKLSRRFLKTDTVQRIFDFLILHFDSLSGESEGVLNFSLCTHFPKVELTEMDQTIEQVGLHPRGMLFVMDLDV